MKSHLSIIGLVLTTIIAALAITYCGGNGNGDSTLTIPGEPALTFTSIKTFHFSWMDVSGATHYKLLENPDGISGFTQVGSDIPQGTQSYDHIVPLYGRVNALYILQNCNATDCNNSSVVTVSGTLVDSIGYFKASNTDAGDSLGGAVSLSADGNSLAVGAPGEDGGAAGIDGDQADNLADGAGAVYVFSRNDTAWSQQAYIKASNPDGAGCIDFWYCSPGDGFGAAISLSADGNTLAVGAPGEDGGAAGIDGDQTINYRVDSGAVYVYIRSDSSWYQQAYIKASNPGGKFVDWGIIRNPGDKFGAAVSLSADGNTLAVGAVGEDSGATGIDGDQTDGIYQSGAVYVFSRSDTGWYQQAYIKASNTGGNFIDSGFTYETGDEFGAVVSLSADGSTLAVGAPLERSNATGIDGDQTDDSAKEAGAVYVFSRNDTAWSQQAYIKASNTDAYDRFGAAISLSADGNSLAVGAGSEDSSTTGIDGDQADNSADGAGAVYVFSRKDISWSQQAYIKASNTDWGDRFGQAVSLSADGSSLAAGATGEDSNATGIDGDQADNSAENAGAVYLY